MSTRLLYHQDDYVKNFEATVVRVDRSRCTIILDATAFYPTGGHQWCDHGRIAKDRRNYFIITDVQKDEAGIVHHRFESDQANIEPGDKVEGTIYWRRRYQHMQLHTAQHLFSAFAQKRFGIATGRADFSPNGGLMVMEKPLSWEQMAVLEADVNQAIARGLSVSRTIADNGRISIAIDGTTSDFCGGTHVRSTGEIAFFKVTAMDNRTLYYHVGSAAQRHTIWLANHALEAAAMFGLKDSSRLQAEISELRYRYGEANDRLKEWAEQATRRQLALAEQTVISLNGSGDIHQLDLSHLSKKQVKNLVKQQLNGQNQVWICLADKRNLLISSSSAAIDASQLLQRFKDKWRIQGGGDARFAQGGPVPDRIAEPTRIVAESLMSRNGASKSPEHKPSSYLKETDHVR